MRSLRFARAATLAEASALTAAPDGSAMLLAGGTTLLDLAKLDVLRPSVLVAAEPFARARRGIAAGPDGLRLGAFATMSDAEAHADVRRGYPVLAEALALSASQQIRNMASLGGNLLQRTRCTYYRDPSWDACNRRAPGSGCQAIAGVARGHAVLGTSDQCIAVYPGDFAQALVALDARLVLEGAAGRRTLAVADLHRLPGDAPERETNLRPGEVVTELWVPARPWFRRSTYVKLRDRASYEFATASAAVALDLDGDRVREARVAVGGVATVPWRATRAEAALRGRPATEAAMAEAAEAAFAEARPRPGLAHKVALGRRAITEALLQASRMEVAHG